MVQRVDGLGDQPRAGVVYFGATGPERPIVQLPLARDGRYLGSPS